MQITTKFNLDLKTFKTFAENIAKTANVGDIYLLYGDLGAEKTTFVQAFAQIFGINATEVSSPTFNLVHVYANKIWHYDLYRLNSLNEIYELGLSEAMDKGITIIEWPNIIENVMPKNAVKIYITESLIDNNLRNIKIVKLIAN